MKRNILIIGAGHVGSTTLLSDLGNTYTVILVNRDEATEEAKNKFDRTTFTIKPNFVFNEPISFKNTSNEKWYNEFGKKRKKGRTRRF